MRKSIWAKGHVRIEAGRFVVLGADGVETDVSEGWLAHDFGTVWVWELDGPRRLGFSPATQIDLRLMPDDITVGQLSTAIERCRAAGGDAKDVVLSAWAAVGAPRVGEMLVQFAASEEGSLLLLAAKANYDKPRLQQALKALDALRKAGGA